MLAPDIIADIKFYTTEENGRKMPTPPNFFGCVFVIGSDNCDGRLLLDSIGSISPGDFKKDVPIKFLCSNQVMLKLKLGSTFLLRDGKIIGEGKVVSILNIET